MSHKKTKAPIATLAINPANPRTITDKAKETLRRALEEFGDLSGIVSNRTTGHLVGGNQRVALFKEAGTKLHIEHEHKPDKWGTVARGYVMLGGVRCPYREVEWPLKREQAAMLAANNHAGTWDDAALAKIVAGLDVDLRGLTGFDADKLSELVASLEQANASDDDPPEQKPDELIAKWPTKKGDVWKIGRHILLCGDALDPDNWLSLGGPFNLCFADPPYELTINAASFKAFIKRDLLLMSTDKLFLQQSVNGFRNFFCYTYDSIDTAMWTSRPLRKHNLIGWWRWVPLDSDFTGLETHTHHDGSNQSTEGDHGQAKPLMLPMTLLPYFTKPGDKFADAFAGAGSTLIAAERLNLCARSIELEPANCALIVERWALETGGVPERIELPYGDQKNTVTRRFKPAVAIAKKPSGPRKSNQNTGTPASTGDGEKE